MADHSLDREPEKRIFTEIADLKRQVQEIRTLQQAGADTVNLQTSADYTITFAFTAGLTADFLYTFTNSGGRKLFTTFEFTLYEGASAVSGNELGNGLNAFQSHWQWSHWRSKWDSDGNNVKDWVAIKNITGGSLTLTMVGSWRYIVSSAAGSV